MPLVKPPIPKYLKEYLEKCSVVEDYKTGLPKGICISWENENWLRDNVYKLVVLSKL